MVLDKKSETIYPGENMIIPTCGDIQQCEHQSRVWWDHTKWETALVKDYISISNASPSPACKEVLAFHAKDASQSHHKQLHRHQKANLGDLNFFAPKGSERNV